MKYLFHNSGDNACGKPAFIFIGNELPKVGEVVQLKLFTRLNGDPCHPGEMIRCGSCNGIVFYPKVTDIMEMEDE